MSTMLQFIIQVSFFLFLLLGFVILRFKTNYNYEQRILSLIVLVRSISIVIAVLSSSFYHGRGLLNPGLLVVSPMANVLLIIYIFKTIYRTININRKLLSLFIPYVLIGVFWFLYQEHENYSPPAIYNLEMIFEVVSLDTLIRILMFGYVILINIVSIYILIGMYQQVNTFFSSEDKVNPLKWLKSSIILMFLTVIMFAIRAFCLNNLSIIAWFVVATGVWFVIIERAVFKYTLLLPANIDFRIRWSYYFIPQVYDAACRLDTVEDKYIYELIWNDIDACMKEKKPFLNQLFVLSDLVSMLDNRYSKQEISDAVNKYSRQTFMALVQQYRIKEAVELIRSNDHSLKEIAFITGFSSPTSFSRSFSNVHGISPREFKKSLNLKQSRD